MTTNAYTEDQNWYFDAIASLSSSAVSVDQETGIVTYDGSIKSDESRAKLITPEELVHATVIGLLCSDAYNYPVEAIGHEMHYMHGSRGSNADEVDVVLYDQNGLPFALFELKPPHDFEREKNRAIEFQLFGTAPLTGSPKLLVYATVQPRGANPELKSICIDYTKYKTFQEWQDSHEPHAINFPKEYRDLSYQPITNGGENPLELNGTLADFRSIALAFHNEFFSEHPDNTIYVNLVKCLLAKIYDERTTKNGEEYRFQVLQNGGQPETAVDVFARVDQLYKEAYRRYIASDESDQDEINNREFPEERVKTVVQRLQCLSITMGAAKNGDVIGTFFEEILRTGFKQDRGMYFTHDNLARFMVEAVGLSELTSKVWKSSNRPENRLPYIIDPACGSGTFLLHCMRNVTDTIRHSAESFAADRDSEEFFKTHLADERPNAWAERFIYGFDPKFVMAITAKVNMVLHGDGSAHILKEDAFGPFASYPVDQVMLRPRNPDQRSVSGARYQADMCETFDLVVSNPPFAVKLTPEARTKSKSTFTLPETTPSEGLFIERCFQLLKPGGRLAVIVPESLLNGKEMMATRIFLYRMFDIKALVSMPRNLFIDTPTKTSILFAQKKMQNEIASWDKKWQTAHSLADGYVAAARKTLHKKFYKNRTAEEIAEAFATALAPMIPDNFWVVKGGKNKSVLPLSVDWKNRSATEAVDHYKSMLKTSDFERFRDQYALQTVAADDPCYFPVYEVDEVGYKLSKRRERQRPNQLLRLRGRETNRDVNNLHLADEECDTVIDRNNPQTVLDEIQSEVSWS